MHVYGVDSLSVPVQGLFHDLCHSRHLFPLSVLLFCWETFDEMDSRRDVPQDCQCFNPTRDPPAISQLRLFPIYTRCHSAFPYLAWEGRMLEGFACLRGCDQAICSLPNPSIISRAAGTTLPSFCKHVFWISYNRLTHLLLTMDRRATGDQPIERDVQLSPMGASGVADPPEGNGNKEAVPPPEPEPASSPTTEDQDKYLQGWRLWALTIAYVPPST